MNRYTIFPGMLQEEQWQISAASMPLPQNLAQQGMSEAVPRYCHCDALPNIIYSKGGSFRNGYTVARFCMS